MAGNLTRKPSVTPNISNFDDARMFRYALGGYNGVTEKYKNECSYTVDGSTFKINSGEIVIDGWQYGIDASGESITVDNIAGTQYYSVYLEIDLSIIDDQKGTIESTYDTDSYPTITKGDDLTELQTGIARLELYRFEASGGVISNVVQRFSLIEVGNVLHAENADLATLATNATNDSDGNPINTTYTKDSDFNTSSQTAFGDYIIEKLKIISDTEISTTLLTVPGNVITVSIPDFTPSDNTHYRFLGYIPFTTGVNLNKFPFIFDIYYKTQPSTIYYNQGLLLPISMVDMTTYSGYSYRQVGIDLRSDGSLYIWNNEPGTHDSYAYFTTISQMTFTKIYKIIE